MDVSACFRVSADSREFPRTIAALGSNAACAPASENKTYHYSTIEWTVVLNPLEAPANQREFGNIDFLQVDYDGLAA